MENHCAQTFRLLSSYKWLNKLPRTIKKSTTICVIHDAKWNFQRPFPWLIRLFFSLRDKGQHCSLVLNAVSRAKWTCHALEKKIESWALVCVCWFCSKSGNVERDFHFMTLKFSFHLKLSASRWLPARIFRFAYQIDFSSTFPFFQKS